MEMPRSEGYTDLGQRHAHEVIHDHVRLRILGCLEEDLERNYADDVLLLTQNSTLHGKDGIRVSAARLGEQLPDAKFEVVALRTSGDYALLIWRAQSTLHCVECGADSFVVRGGKIWVQTVHYRLLE